MAKFLDITGLQTLWNKIKSNFAPLNKSFTLHNPAADAISNIIFTFNTTNSIGTNWNTPSYSLNLSPSSGIEIYNNEDGYAEMTLESGQLLFYTNSDMEGRSLMSSTEFLVTDNRGYDAVRIFGETGNQMGLLVNYDVGAKYRLQMDGVRYLINPTKLKELGLLVREG